MIHATFDRSTHMRCSIHTVHFEGFVTSELEGYLTKCAPHRALKLIGWCKLTFDERAVVHRVDPLPSGYGTYKTGSGFRDQVLGLCFERLGLRVYGSWLTVQGLGWEFRV